MTPTIQAAMIRGARCGKCGGHHAGVTEVRVPEFAAGMAHRVTVLSDGDRFKELTYATHADAGVLVPAAPRMPANDGSAPDPTEVEG